SSYPYANPGAINDVVGGSNSVTCQQFDSECRAVPGYDGPTGLGTPHGVTAFSAGQAGDVAGTVTEAPRGKPLAGATVSANGMNTTTDAQGTYRLHLPVGIYTVTATSFDHVSQTRSNIAVGDASVSTQNFGLAAIPQVAVSGTVTDGSGH